VRTISKNTEGDQKFYKLPNDSKLQQLVQPTDVWGPCRLEGKFHSSAFLSDTVSALCDSCRPSMLQERVENLTRGVLVVSPTVRNNTSSLLSHSYTFRSHPFMTAVLCRLVSMLIKIMETVRAVSPVAKRSDSPDMLTAFLMKFCRPREIWRCF
jgi:hypothetical protein